MRDQIKRENHKRCPYCESREYRQQGYKEIAQMDVVCGFLGEMEIGISLGRSDDRNEGTLYLWLVHDVENGIRGDGVMESEVKIKYCPFCGNRMKREPS